MLSLLKSGMLAAAVAVVSMTAVVRAETRIQGAGASFPAPLYAKWIEAYNAANKNVKVDYQPIGSGGGIKGITDRTVVFAGSDAPMTKDQESKAPGKVLHLPTVAGPVVMIYNLPGIDSLKLSGEVVADIYLNKIKMWNDPKIAALNAGVALPGDKIVVVHRSDPSGTTYIFTDYLSKASKEWADKELQGTDVEWPVGLAGAKNPGVAAMVKGTKGGIGYVESAYATKEKLPYAMQINKDGKEVKASIAGVEAATAAVVKQFPADLKVSIVNAPGAESYPIAGFTYLLVYEDMSYLKNKELATETVKFINWCVTDGQKTAEENGYAKLPAEAQTKVIEALKSVKFEGEALLK